jgi:hypothetical protein
MNYLAADLTEKEFLDFLNELCHLYSKYSNFLKHKGHFISFENIAVILASGDINIKYRNMTNNLVSVSIFSKELLIYTYVTTLSDEVYTASIFMGTSLFSNYNKVSVREVDFISKFCTDIRLRKSSSLWNVTIDLIH